MTNTEEHIEERIGNIASQRKKDGVRYDVANIHPQDFHNVVARIGAKVEYRLRTDEEYVEFMTIWFGCEQSGLLSSGRVIVLSNQSVALGDIVFDEGQYE